MKFLEEYIVNNIKSMNKNSFTKEVAYSYKNLGKYNFCCINKPWDKGKNILYLIAKNKVSKFCTVGSWSSQLLNFNCLYNMFKSVRANMFALVTV